MTPYNHTNALFFSLKDLNECNEMPERCGFGICINNENATFYNCLCQGGAMITGERSQGNLTCVGQLYIHLKD